MKIDFDKDNGLVPAIIQGATTKQVLMLGYMNNEALEKTRKEKLVTFFSRSKNRLWTKGETSGNYLELVSIQEDCDQDALLVKVNPQGSTCHKGSTSCFGESEVKGFLYKLEFTIQDRLQNPKEGSYTSSLAKKGTHKIAQKVGEEAVELVIEALRDNDEDFKNEAADLLYHFLILLYDRKLSLSDIEGVLKQRMKTT